MAEVSRSPFEYYPGVASTGGGISAAFQQGQSAAEQLARSQSAGERERALLPFELQEKQTLDRMRQQSMELARASEGRTAADYQRKGEAFEAAGGAMPAGMRQPAQGDAGRGMVPNLPGAAGLIAGFEGFQPASYDDVTSRGGQRVSAGQRIGFGSDTITRADGSVVRVTPGMTVTQEDAVRDLQRRITTEFAPRAVEAVGPQTWGTLSPAARDALVSVTYNYGSLPDALAAAARTGDPNRIAAAIEGLAGDNDGINRARRLREAAYIRENVEPGTAPAAAPAAPAAGLNLPQGALSPAPMGYSTGGVPMSMGTDADLPAQGVAESQFIGAPQAGTAATDPRVARIAELDAVIAAATPVADPSWVRSLRQERQRLANESQFIGAPLDAQGRPVGQTAPAFNRLPGAAPVGGPVEPSVLDEFSNTRAGAILSGIGSGVSGLFGSRFAGITGEGATPATPATPATAPSVGLSQPIANMLPGAVPTVPQTFNVGGVPASLGGMMSPVPVGQQVAPIAAAAPLAARAPTPGAPPPAPTTIPALLEPTTIARERQALEVQRQAVLNQRRIAIASRDAQSLGAADAALAQIAAEDTRVGGMEALTKFRQGNPGALANYFYDMTNGAMRIQKNANDTYNVFNGNQIAARNLTPETLEGYFRASFDRNVIERVAETRKTQAARAGQLFETQLKMLQDAGQQEAIGTRDQALEKLKAAIKARTGQDPKMEIQNDTVYIFDPNNQRVSVGKMTNKSVTGQTLPNGQTRLVFDAGAYGTVPTGR